MNEQPIKEKAAEMPKLIDCFWKPNKRVRILEAQDYYNPRSETCKDCKACQV